ncbi:phosphate acetyltransferase [Helicobacter cetorum]|uniref:Phosphate acetyltransferase n=1 Tax=Helicobacter cetorum (strain ATCC BAA-429 / MIT 00-7128) TaxID=182217 RepID=I0EP75_HELC0|nr:phosphate acetyltransferase [Helicobacter cetorum]AFI04744.1 phosphotransacetylase [Helicobacter cetorum MIT 00-7128]
MQSLWIYPESLDGLNIACKALVKVLEPHYKKIALFSPIDGGCERLGDLNLLSAINKQEALELISKNDELRLHKIVLKRYLELTKTYDFILCLGYVPKFFLNALIDLNITLSKHLNAPILGVVQSEGCNQLALERLEAMRYSALNKGAVFETGLVISDEEFKETLPFKIANISKDNHQGLSLEFLQSVKSSVVTPLFFQNSLEMRAKAQIKKVVLPESEDGRILKATHYLINQGVVELILLGNAQRIYEQAKSLGLDLGKVEIIDPSTSSYRDEFANSLYELRKSKGMSLDEAKELVQNRTYFATMLVHLGYADAMVSGAIHTTADTIRPALQIIKTKPNASLVSSVFFMCLDTQVLVFGDCAINPNPNAKELAQIAITSAETAKQFGIEPKVAMLSYSTGSSGKGEMVDKVKEALELAKEHAKDFHIDGPLQFDASIDMSVAKQKMPHSEVAGQANVFIFPDLNAGNIGYKAVQRSAKAIAIGPVLQGLNKPINDLSRGCLVEDVINTVLISAIQAQSK